MPGSSLWTTIRRPHGRTHQQGPAAVGPSFRWNNPDTDDPRRAAARAQIADCDRKLVRYRAALDAGGDETTIAGWISETTVHRAAAKALLAPTRPHQQQRHMTRQEITDLVDRLDDLRRTLRDAEPESKAAVYTALGVTLIYQPSKHSLLVEACPAPRRIGVRVVSEGRPDLYTYPPQIDRLAL